MLCPKCNQPCSDKATECRHCGIIFSKYYRLMEERAERRANASEVKVIDTTGSRIREVKQLLFEVEDEVNPFVFWGRIVLFVIIVIYGAKFCLASIASNYAGQSFLHLVNLPFHEAGHVLFTPFPRLLTSLGGTLGQLLIPLICMFAMLLQARNPFGASICFWWFGQNFFDIAPYINDARSLSLPLLGGNVGSRSPYGFHDWEYILGETGLLRYDHFLAGTAVAVGMMIFFLAYAWGAYLLFRQYQNL